MILLDAGASKEAPFVLEADGSSDSPDEAQPYVYPPHLDGLRTHGDEVDVDSILAVAELRWPTSAFVGVICFCFLAIGLSIFGWASYVDSAPVEQVKPFQFLLVVAPVAYVFATLLCRATVGIMINQGYYAKGPEWDVSLGAQPKKNSPAFELMACPLFFPRHRRGVHLPEGRAWGRRLGAGADRPGRPVAVVGRRGGRHRRPLGPLL